MAANKNSSEVKQLDIQIDGVDYLALQAPEGADRFSVFNDREPYLSYFLRTPRPLKTPRHYLPAGEWLMIGIAKDLDLHYITLMRLIQQFELDIERTVILKKARP